MGKNRLIDIVGIGTPAMDILYPESGSVERKPGGSIVNTISTLSMLGLNTSLIGKVGPDREGEELLKEFARLGIDTRLVTRQDGYKTPCCHIRIRPDNKEISTQDEYGYSDFSEQHMKHIKSCGAVYLELNNPFFSKYARIATGEGKPLFVTLNLLGVFRDGDAEEMLKHNVTAVFGNEKENEKIDSRTRKQLLERGTEIVVTKGDRGCTVLTKNGKTDYQAHKAKSVDPTGAGDAFAAGYMYGMLKGMEAIERAELANLLGAVATVTIGARIEF